MLANCFGSSLLGIHHLTFILVSMGPQIPTQMTQNKQKSSSTWTSVGQTDQVNMENIVYRFLRFVAEFLVTR